MTNPIASGSQRTRRFYMMYVAEPAVMTETEKASVILALRRRINEIYGELTGETYELHH